MNNKKEKGNSMNCGIFISNDNLDSISITGIRTGCDICGENMANNYFTKQYEPYDFNNFFPRTPYAKLKTYLKENIQIIGICVPCREKVIK